MTVTSTESAAVPKKPTNPQPTDEVRLVAVLTREQRARFRYFCDRIGSDVERLSAQWILDRLESEEKKLPKR